MAHPGEGLIDLDDLAVRDGKDYSTDTLDVYATCIPESGNISGDYVGIVRMGNNVRIVTTDGMGKGLLAHNHAHRVTQEFFVRAHANGNEHALEDLSRRFAKESGESRKMFFSAFMLVDVQQGTKFPFDAIFYGMGQPSPLIYRAGARQIETLPSLAGVAIGLPLREDDEQKPYSIFSASLDESDVLLLYSDGVTEARSARGRLFSEVRNGLEQTFRRSVRRWKPADEIVQDILYKIVEHCGGKAQDDITLVVARVKEQA